jgi:hypothetical protein
MRADQPQGTARDRCADGTGKALREIYPPDGAADATLNRLIDQLGQVPWPKSEGESDARH